MAAYKYILCNSNFNINNSPTRGRLTTWPSSIAIHYRSTAFNPVNLLTDVAQYISTPYQTSHSSAPSPAPHTSFSKTPFPSVILTQLRSVVPPPFHMPAESFHDCIPSQCHQQPSCCTRVTSPSQLPAKVVFPRENVNVKPKTRPLHESLRCRGRPQSSKRKQTRLRHRAV